MTPPTTSDLIFSEQANHNFSKTLGEIKKHTLSIRNRLQSILEDASFVCLVSNSYGRPLISNERCGSWYIDPENKDGSAYFKSTDGHTGVWSFSLRRLNIHLFEIIGRNDGCIIADSTRRGKRMPDALSKTIPIWCSVLNRALFPERIECHELYTPPRAVSSSEHEQITSRLGGFLQSFLALEIDRTALRALITKPLRPIWVTPDSFISTESSTFEDFHPVICCTASRRVLGGEVSEGGYIQGSGDDTENWAHGLTPPIFWANTQLFLSTPEPELPGLISRLVASPSPASISQPRKIAPIPPTTSLYITDLHTLSTLPPDTHRLTICLRPDATPLPAIQPNALALTLTLNLGPHKLGSRNLRTALPAITAFITTHLTPPAASANNSPSPSPKISITTACTTGKDHAIGVALALLCLFYTPTGHLASGPLTDRPEITKPFIRQRLSWIVAAMPDANPSGATLQSVNSFLMRPPPPG